MKKKLFSIIMCVLMVMCFMPSMAFADVVADGWDVLTESDSGALSTEGNKIVITPSANDGAYTKTMRNNPIQNGTTTYDVIVDLSEDYQHGDLFTTSLGFGTDANTYNTEFCVATQRSGDNFILTAGVAPNESITLAPGVYTYRYSVTKGEGGSLSSSFEVVETGEKLNFTDATESAKLQQSKYVRYLWAFGRDVNNTYTLDRNLVMYKTPVVAKVGSEAYTTLAAAVEAANTGRDKVITLVASASVDDLTIPADITLKIINRAKLTVSGNLTVNGTLDMSKATPTENSFALEIKAGAYYNVNGNVISGSQTFADVRQLGTLTITNTGKYQIKAAGMTEASTYIGAGGAVTLGENSKVVSVPNDNEDYADGYTYTLTGTATANNFTILGNDSFVIPNNSEFKVNELTLNGAKKNQLIVENGGKLSKAVAEPTFSIESGKWEVTSGTFYFDPSSYKTGNYVPDGYVSTENNDGSYTVSKKVVYGGGSSSSKTSTTTTELEKAKAEAKADVKTEAEASKYEDAEAAEVKAIKEQADKDIAAAKTVEEVKQIEAEAEAKIEAIPTAEEKAEIATVKGVSKQVFKAKSKKAKLHGKKAIKVSWTLPAGISVDGFEVYRSTSKFSGFGTEPYFTTTKSTYTNNKDLEKGNTYYYKVKGYKMINGEKVYTGWSTKAYRTI